MQIILLQGLSLLVMLPVQVLKLIFVYLIKASAPANSNLEFKLVEIYKSVVQESTMSFLVQVQPYLHHMVEVFLRQTLVKANFIISKNSYIVQTIYSMVLIEFNIRIMVWLL